MKLWVAIAALLPACDIPCSFLWMGTPSYDRNAVFAYVYSDVPLSRPMAAGGALTSVGVCTDKGPAIARVVSTNQAVVSASKTSSGDEFDLVTGAAGQSDLVAYDAADAEIGRVTLTVADTTELLVEHGWPGTSAAILAGQTLAMHATTQRDGETLVGVGAVKFSTTGSVHLTQPGSAFLLGDVAWFRGQAGIGSVVASCPSARATVPITVVDPSAITRLAPSRTALRFGANEGGLLSVSVFAGTQEVYVAVCTWTSEPTGLLFDRNASYIEICGRNREDCRFTMPGESLDAPPTFQYFVGGPAGNYQATCTIPGGPSTTVFVEID